MARELIMTESIKSCIPPEIQALIVDEIHRDATASSKEKYETLSKCCLVSSWWLERARHWLFSDYVFHIDAEDDPPETAQFIEFLQSPHSRLASCVLYLQIYGPDIPCGPHGTAEDYDVLSTSIAAALPYLHTVHTLDLYTLVWDRLTDRAREALQHLPRITSLTWYEVTFERTTLPDFLFLLSRISPYLEVLDLTGQAYIDSKAAVNSFPPLPIIFPHLHTLLILAWPITAPLLLSDAFAAWHTLSNLHILPVDEAPHLLRCIEAMGPHLQHLTLLSARYWDDYDDTAPLPLSLHKNSNLSSLNLDFGIRLPKQIPWVSRLIASSISTSLDVHIICGSAGRMGDFNLLPLERTLLGDESKVRRLHLKRYDKETTKYSWFDDKERLLPELLRRGRLFW